MNVCDMCGAPLQPGDSYAVAIDVGALYDFKVCGACRSKLEPSLKFLYDKQIVDKYLFITYQPEKP